MSGLDKIISQIQDEAKAQAEKILEEANAKAGEIRREADAACLAAAQDAKTQCGAVREDVLRKSRSSAQMQRKRELLGARQELIDEMIRDAHSALLELETPDYFAALSRLLKKHVQPQSGELLLCERDLRRMPGDFAETAAETAKEKGGSLTVSKKPCEIDGGFLLVYGDIEENCSFEALFLAEREKLQDSLHTFLFA